MPWRCQPGSSSCREGSKPSGATYGLKSSDTKTRTKVGVVHPSTDLHVTFAVHPIASNGLGGIIIYIIYMYLLFWNTHHNYADTVPSQDPDHSVLL